MRFIKNLSTILLCCIVVSNAFAAPKPKDPKEIKVKERAELNFGVVTIPFASSSQIIVTPDGAIGAGTTAVILDSSFISAGEYEVKGDDEVTIQMQVPNGSTGIVGLTLKDFTARYGGALITLPAVGLAPPTSSGTTLLLGATLELTPDIISGEFLPAFDIVIEYE